MSQPLGSNSRTISGAQLLVSGKGVVTGFIVNSHSSGTLKLWDSLTATGRILMNTFTFPTGSSVQTFPAPLNFHTGLFADMSADESVTIVYNEA